MNLKKNYLYANSTSQRCPIKKKILIEDFFHLPPVTTTLVAKQHWWQTLSFEYLREFVKKFETALMV
jgi:hypothetical protein